MLYLFLIFYLAVLIWIAIELAISPRGYEDDLGFHYDNFKNADTHGKSTGDLS